MNYPLQINFKILAIAQQLSLTEATGNLIFYVKQKAFKLKEAVTVFADEAMTRPWFTINADRAIDFRANYTFTDLSGRPFGSMRRLGKKSLWKASYEIFDGYQPNPVGIIREENPWAKVFDAVLGEIPILGVFTGYLFHPSYLITRPDGMPYLRLKKQPSFVGRKFTIDKLAHLDQTEELRLLLGVMMMVLLERARG
ncbi:MAG TPA: hypothetical protein VN256_24060 [Pyrinomonadaceae bacterium]|nr:hypothetical protein [Pyrinomonadaceae bacterium]